MLQVLKGKGEAMKATLLLVLLSVAFASPALSQVGTTNGFFNEAFQPSMGAAGVHQLCPGCPVPFDTTLTATCTSTQGTARDSLAGATAKYHYPIWQAYFISTADCYWNAQCADGDSMPTAKILKANQAWNPSPLNYYKIWFTRGVTDAELQVMLWPDSEERAAP